MIDVLEQFCTALGPGTLIKSHKNWQTGDSIRNLCFHDVRFNFFNTFTIIMFQSTNLIYHDKEMRVLKSNYS